MKIRLEITCKPVDTVPRTRLSVQRTSVFLLDGIIDWSMSLDSYTGSSDSAVCIYHHQKIVYRNKRCLGQVLEMKHLHLLYVLILVVMGNFKGHALPGSCLFILGIWWTIKCILKYAFKKQKRTSYLDSKALFRRIEILEGIVLVGMALTGE